MNKTVFFSRKYFFFNAFRFNVRICLKIIWSVTNCTAARSMHLITKSENRRIALCICLFSLLSSATTLFVCLFFFCIFVPMQRYDCVHRVSGTTCMTLFFIYTVPQFNIIFNTLIDSEFINHYENN